MNEIKLSELAAKLRADQAKCNRKAAAAALDDDYMRGLITGYAAAYGIAADRVDAAIFEQQIAKWDALLTEWENTIARGGQS